MSTVADQIKLTCNVISNHPATEGKAVCWEPVAERVGNDILLIRNAIPRLDRFPDIVDSFGHLFSTATVMDDGLQECSNTEIRRCGRLALAGTDCPDELIFYGMLCQAIEGQMIATYIEHVNVHAVVHVGSGYDLLRYDEGGYFHEHVDVARDHPVLGHRRLSVVAFCNDDFDGGELVFPRQDVIIRPEVGLMVLFPSGFTHPHESTEITRGTKYSIVTWFF